MNFPFLVLRASLEGNKPSEVGIIDKDGTRAEQRRQHEYLIVRTYGCKWGCTLDESKIGDGSGFIQGVNEITLVAESRASA